MCIRIFMRRRAGQHSIARARSLVLRAIRELDEVGAPADIAAHLDHAAHRLDEL